MDKKLDLYEHNIESYEKVKEAYLDKNIASIVHATGTGKSYNALQLARDNKDKKIIYVVPSNSIIEHLKELLKENNIDLEKDLPNLEFRTYQSFINMSKEELANLDVDLLILDEFHHLGAPVWGERINTIIETHPNMKIFGMTAYTVRDRGTPFERDMVSPETNEIFSNTVVSRYDLCDAIIDGVLPKPIYRSCYSRLLGREKAIEEKVLKGHATTEEKEEYLEILKAVKKRIFEAPSTYDIIKRDVKNGTKWIYYCPVGPEQGKNDIDTIMDEAYNWFKRYIPEEDIILYKTTSEDGDFGRKNREAFYNDVDLEGKRVKRKLRVMFTKNQYNEGVHAPNVDGVILGRSTMSDIVFFEQIGRCLSVKGDTKKKYLEYEKYSYEDLLNVSKERNIQISDELPKEEIIEKLLAPVIIDLTNNHEFIRELETNLKNRIKERQENKTSVKKEIKIRNASFDIKVENIDLFETLTDLEKKLAPMTWDDWYKLAKSYYKHHGSLKGIYNFKTLNGYEYDETGYNLGNWINTQKQAYRNNFIPKEERKNLITPLADDRVKKLEHIGMVFSEKTRQRYTWDEMYNLAKTYYGYYGNLRVPRKFKTLNGYEYDENGKNLYSWVHGVYNQYGASMIFYYDKESYVNDIRFFPLTEEQLKRLGNIPLSDIKETNVRKYNKILVETYGMTMKNARYLTERFPKEVIVSRILYLIANDIPLECKVPSDHVTNMSEAIGDVKWLHEIFFINESNLKEKYKMNYKGILLEKSENQKIEWHKMYELLRKYNAYYGNISIPRKFKTINGYVYDENGKDLGIWKFRQQTEFISYVANKYERKKSIEIPILSGFHDSTLTKEQFEKLAELDILSEIHTDYEWQKQFFVNNITDELKISVENAEMLYERLPREIIDRSINYLLINHIPLEKNGKLHEIFFISDNNFKENYGMDYKGNLLYSKNSEKHWNKMYELLEKYYAHYGDISVPIKFKTINGYDYDENGYILGSWMVEQKKAFNLYYNFCFKSKYYHDKSMPIKNIKALISEEQFEKLCKISMTFEKNKEDNTKQLIEAILLKCKIEDWKISAENVILLAESLPQEVIGQRILWMHENNIPFEQDEKLHGIFFMSTDELKEKYNIDELKKKGK